MTVWIVKHETDIGPVFDDKEKLISHLRYHCDCSDARIARILDGRDPYITIFEPPLNDPNWIQDS